MITKPIFDYLLCNDYQHRLIISKCGVTKTDSALLFVRLAAIIRRFQYEATLPTVPKQSTQQYEKLKLMEKNINEK
jgi:hypothetical protein